MSQRNKNVIRVQADAQALESNLIQKIQNPQLNSYTKAQKHKQVQQLDLTLINNANKLQRLAPYFS
jgi:hypothetical protein